MNDAAGVSTGIPRPLVTGPSAWLGPDLAEQSGLSDQGGSHLRNPLISID
jgi:hypothetical protein